MTCFIYFSLCINTLGKNTCLQSTNNCHDSVPGDPKKESSDSLYNHLNCWHKVSIIENYSNDMFHVLVHLKETPACNHHNNLHAENTVFVQSESHLSYCNDVSITGINFKTQVKCVTCFMYGDKQNTCFYSTNNSYGMAI